MLHCKTPASNDWLTLNNFRVCGLRVQNTMTSTSTSEPTLLLGHALDVFDLARDAGYYNTDVRKGYRSEGTLKLLAEHALTP